MIEAQTFSYHRMQYLLRQPMDDHANAMALAKKECQASKNLHADVWAHCFTDKFVTEVVLKLLEGALEHIAALERNQEEVLDYDPELVISYKDNIKDRIANITENYLKRKPSLFLPQDKLRVLVRKRK